MLQFRFAALSETGPVREHNEDAGFAGPYLLCVADGVGGAAAGEIASATTAYIVSARSLAAPGYDPDRLLRAAVADAHDQARRGHRRGPGPHRDGHHPHRAPHRRDLRRAGPGRRLPGLPAARGPAHPGSRTTRPWSRPGWTPAG
ncbi:hypothetical protein [Nocardioides convexus]|uniref:hypothetical protein n=1 Tax=Nocardioides convexus TaxID=2712224 RepID=UPI0024184052|nr:hypothetical protein [Nocardioides convexus]